jgi:hypothetical protein
MSVLSSSHPKDQSSPIDLALVTIDLALRREKPVVRGKSTRRPRGKADDGVGGVGMEARILGRHTEAAQKLVARIARPKQPRKDKVMDHGLITKLLTR